MITHRFLGPLVASAALLLTGTWSSNARADDASFKHEAHPILLFYCASCHTPPNGEGFEKSGLDITTYESIMKGTKLGPIIVPGDAFSSNMMVLIEGRASKQLKMPHNDQELSKWEKTILRRWINRGAKND
ncbi:MAG: hypothetical protein A3G18_06970 [Rhodospirillales bacterium RIFCSPLOWO2_12_FULL_58_28]|nr:MAG: hypothetical protein A3H92_11535 [Rhodospirillales bacterium RIFCSPLOWO2_02_FULL_58_16]OHC77467.1 MAG: hypothetical protein A3G18_06970 [Rhodospirillales bacterium RIFCSPLOWO2_12_FULL_58_28]